MKKRVLITGASSGIGRACAQVFAEKSYEVIALARRKNRLAELEAKHPNIQGLAVDLRFLKDEDIKGIDLSKIDVLINNAGLALGLSSVEQTREEDWLEMIQTNLIGLIRMTQKVVDQMIKRSSGDIVNVGSIAAYQTYAGGSIYSATKYAVRALTEAWRKDLLGKNIRVMGIHPGMVETEFSEVRLKGDKLAAKKVYEGMRPLTAKDIAEAILWSVECPPHVCIESLVIMPTDQAASGLVYRRSN
jgi:NADP-dependent 3-hydroxy acid dehydrogenase YdfG